MDIESFGQQELVVVPPLKWAGGKRWLFQALDLKLPQDTKRYFEPFVGSAAAFFSFAPRIAFLSDTNAELINLYACLRDAPRPLKKLLEHHHRSHSSEYYYEIRAAKYRNEIKRAARTLYLNRTCWNGLYRVNTKGQFNVPIGTKTSVIYESDNFEAISERLKGAKIELCDFEVAIGRAGRGDFIFADPPYTVKHNLNGFVKYNEKIFSWDDQIRLRDCLSAAKERGARVFLTNANHASIIDLYRDGFDVRSIERASVIAGNSKYRGKTSELLIS